jgi:hypothetical protein
MSETPETPETVDPRDGLKLDLTGKAVLIFESNWGPIEFRFDDLEITMDLLRIVVDNLGPSFPINTFEDTELVNIKNLLSKEIKDEHVE